VQIFENEYNFVGNSMYSDEISAQNGEENFEKLELSKKKTFLPIQHIVYNI